MRSVDSFFPLNIILINIVLHTLSPWIGNVFCGMCVFSHLRWMIRSLGAWFALVILLIAAFPLFEQWNDILNHWWGSLLSTSLGINSCRQSNLLWAIPHHACMLATFTGFLQVNVNKQRNPMLLLQWLLKFWNDCIMIFPRVKLYRAKCFV